MNTALKGKAQHGLNEQELSQQKRLAKLAWLLDSSIKVPGTNFRIGLEALLGLVPGVGDVAGGAISSWIILQGAKLGVSKSVLARMGVNVMVDVVVGAIPILGDLFDMAYKANNRNVRLMEDYFADPQTTRRKSAGGVALAVLIILLTLAAIIAAFVGLVALVASLV